MGNVEEIIQRMREECKGCPFLGEHDCKADPYLDGCYKEKKNKLKGNDDALAKQRVVMK